MGRHATRWSMLPFVLAACSAESAIDGGPADAGAVDATAPIDSPVDAPPDAPLPPRQFILDSQGRAIVLHGLNDGSAKDDPLRSPSFTEDDVRRFSEEWGFDFDRYLVFWDAAEPMPGVIDEAYFDRIQQRLDWFAAHDMVVMLDLHQDVYARRFCCDGAPDWAIRDDGASYMLQSDWSLDYLQPAVEHSFDNFWSYEDPNRDLQDHYGDVWVALATRFHDHPAVLGFDLMNEPWPGSAFDFSQAARGVGAGPLGTTADFDRGPFAAFYERLIARIRAVDNDHWIFIEPRGVIANGAIQYLPPIADPRVGPSRIVFAPHLYSFPYSVNSRYDSSDPTVPHWEASRRAETRTQNWPILMGEFGMDRTFPGASQYLDDVLQMADRMMISWSYWAFTPGTWGFWDPATMTEHPNIDQLVRVYPRRIAGTPTGWSWDRTAHVFTLTFDTAPAATGPTELFVPSERFFPTGYDLTSTDPPGSWTQTWDPVRHILSITTSPTIPTHAFTLTPR